LGQTAARLAVAQRLLNQGWSHLISGMNPPKRILLIDHEPRLTAIVSSALRASGQYLIHEESYSPKALQTAIHFQPDLILVDAEPEHLEIDQVAGQIHAERALHDIPVVCLTSLAPNGQIGTVGFLGDYTFVANPFQIDDMVRCIAEILKKKRARHSSRNGS
jgi:CheY-like chemotaxis protein